MEAPRRSATPYPPTAQAAALGPTQVEKSAARGRSTNGGEGRFDGVPTNNTEFSSSGEEPPPTSRTSNSPLALEKAENSTPNEAQYAPEEDGYLHFGAFCPSVQRTMLESNVVVFHCFAPPYWFAVSQATEESSENPFSSQHIPVLPLQNVNDTTSVPTSNVIWPPTWIENGNHAREVRYRDPVHSFARPYSCFVVCQATEDLSLNLPSRQNIPVLPLQQVHDTIPVLPLQQVHDTRSAPMSNVIWPPSWIENSNHAQEVRHRASIYSDLAPPYRYTSRQATKESRTPSSMRDIKLLPLQYVHDTILGPSSNVIWPPSWIENGNHAQEVRYRDSVRYITKEIRKKQQRGAAEAASTVSLVASQDKAKTKQPLSAKAATNILGPVNQSNYRTPSHDTPTTFQDQPYLWYNPLSAGQPAAPSPRLQTSHALVPPGPSFLRSHAPAAAAKGFLVLRPITGLLLDVDEDTEKKKGVEQDKLTNSDFLCGRGGKTNDHNGNAYLRSLATIDRLRISTMESQKSDISEKIVKEMRSFGGRFLKQDENDGLYYEIGDKKAKQKVSKMLTHLNKKPASKRTLRDAALASESYCAASTVREGAGTPASKMGKEASATGDHGYNAGQCHKRSKIADGA